MGNEYKNCVVYDDFIMYNYTNGNVAVSILVNPTGKVVDIHTGNALVTIPHTDFMKHPLTVQTNVGPLTLITCNNRIITTPYLNIRGNGILIVNKYMSKVEANIDSADTLIRHQNIPTPEIVKTKHHDVLLPCVIHRKYIPTNDKKGTGTIEVKWSANGHPIVEWDVRVTKVDHKGIITDIYSGSFGAHQTGIKTGVFKGHGSTIQIGLTYRYSDDDTKYGILVDDIMAPGKASTWWNPFS